MNVMGITDRGQVVGSNFAEDVDPAAGGACTQIAALIATRFTTVPAGEPDTV
jgi:hypothetical protein